MMIHPLKRSVKHGTRQDTHWHPEGGTVGWDMCISETNFDRSVVDKFSDYVGVDVLSCWVLYTYDIVPYGIGTHRTTKKN